MAEAATMEVDETGFEDLKDQLIQKRDAKQEPQQEDNQESEKPEPKQEPERKQSSAKKYKFHKGEEIFELDEDAEIEMMADKKAVKLTLKELRERAAGDIAVKNRMHSLAEEKKKVTSTFKEFASIAKNDPLGALEYIADKAKETDSEFEYQNYLNKLAEQAEKLGSMSEEERKAWELEKKLNKANEDLSLKDRESSVVRKKQEILGKFDEIGDSKFGEIVESVMDSEELMSECENEMDVMNMAERVIEEALLQADISDLVGEFDPDYSSDNELIFAIRDQVVQNPDFDAEDVRDLIQGVLGPAKKQKAAKVLSERQRTQDSVENQKRQGASDYELLKEQLEERRNEQRNNKR